MTSETERDGGSAPTGVFVAGTDAERDDAFAVRLSVFVDEQGVDEGIEYDEHDEPGAAATHFVAYDAGDPIGAARLRVVDDADDPAAKIERVAVAADRRGEGGVVG